MAKFSQKFILFLYANKPETYRLVAGNKDVPDDLYNQIIARFDSLYKMWLSIPQWIKDKNHGKIPDEVASGQISIEAYIKKQEDKEKQEQKEINETISTGVGVLAAGYAVETAMTLAGNKALRESLLASATDGVLNPEQQEQWLESRKNDMAAILLDWEIYQPEKYLLHMAKELNRANKRYTRTESAEEKAELDAKINELKEKFEKFTANLGTPGTEFKNNILSYLRQQPQQAALRHLDKDTLSMFTSAMQNLGIKIEPVQFSKAHTQELPDKDSLTNALRKQFERKIQQEAIIINMAERSNNDFQRITARQVIRMRHPSLAPIIKIRKTRPAQNVQSA